MMTSLILAGGQSKRFGGPKLLANLGGIPLGLHVANTVARLALPLNLAVCGPNAPDYASVGFVPVPLEPVDAPQSRSLAMGMAAARRAGATAVLVVLADMPLVPLAHFQAMIAGFDGHSLATRAGETLMPPALFSISLFPKQENRGGDSGARALLHAAPSIDLDPADAQDVDTLADLHAAAERLSRMAL